MQRNVGIKQLVIKESGKVLRMCHPRLWMEFRLRMLHSRFEQEFWLIPILCDKAKLAIDVGANIGLYSYYMAKHSREVIAFEPNDEFSNPIRRLMGRDFRLERVALSQHSGSAILRVDEGDTGTATIEDRNDLSTARAGANIRARRVETRTLDSFGLTSVSMIKIDVEGHEESVIAGAIATIQNSWPVLLVESEDRHNQGAPQRLRNTLRKLGYGGFYVEDGRLMELSTLSPKSTNPTSLFSSRSRYINNFIFIPNARILLVEEIQRVLSKGLYGN